MRGQWNVVVCCGVLRCVAACCSVLQCVEWITRRQRRMVDQGGEGDWIPFLLKLVYISFENRRSQTVRVWVPDLWRFTATTQKYYIHRHRYRHTDTDTDTDTGTHKWIPDAQATAGALGSSLFFLGLNFSRDIKSVFRRGPVGFGV